MKRVFTFFLFISLFLNSTYADAKKFTSDQVKAAYLFNFLQFIEWPATASKGETIKIGIVGQLSSELKENISKINGKKVNTSTIQVEFFANASGAITQSNTLAMFYIAELSENEELELLKHFSQKPVLSVGNRESFIQNGGMVNFVNKDSRILFDINLVQVEKNSFRVPSRLQRIANQVIR